MNSTLFKKICFGAYMGTWSWPECNEDPSDWESLRFQSMSGAWLTGIYSKSDQESKGTIVCGHPMDPLAKGYFLKYGHSMALKKAGYDVFLFDFNGFGVSENGTFDFPKDVIAAVKTASDISGRKSVGYMGISFGASWAISAMKQAHTIEAAFLECPFTSLERFCRKNPKACYAIKTLRYLKPSLFRNINPLINAHKARSVKHIKLIYNLNDNLTPPVVGNKFLSHFNIEENYKTDQVSWFTIPTIDGEIEVLPGGGHGRGHTNPEYFNLLTRFFDRSIMSSKVNYRSTIPGFANV